jgi:hypothetical protein
MIINPSRLAPPAIPPGNHGRYEIAYAPQVSMSGSTLVSIGDPNANGTFSVPGGASAPTYAYPWLTFTGSGSQHLRNSSGTYGNLGSKWTVAVAIKTSASGAIRIAACKGDGWTIGITAAGTPVFALDFGFGLIPLEDAAIVLNDGDPHLLIATYDIDLEELRFYVDGVLSPSSPVTLGILNGNTAGTTDAMRIGRGETVTLPWEGGVGFIAVYPDVAFDDSAAELLTNYSRAVYVTL